MNKLRVFGSIAVAIVATSTLLALSLWLNPRESNEIGGYFVYQGWSLFISGAVILALWLLSGRKLQLLKIGNLRASASANRVLGIKGTESWQSIGLTFAVVISAVTGIFLLANYANSFAAVPLAGWMMAMLVAIPLSVMNAFNEEIITRWSIAEGLAVKYANAAPWVSAALFGTVHFIGVPGGVIGSVMAGFLGWFLTKSIQETRGIGWAWAIHFVQDVLIFTVTIATLG